MTLFRGKIIKSDAHYEINGGYKWQTGDVSIWDTDYTSNLKAGIAYRYVNVKGKEDWNYSTELQDLCVYLGINDYTEENAATLERILKDVDLDQFTMKEFFGDKAYIYEHKPKITELETPWAGIF
jgi:hypothetical protein